MTRVTKFWPRQCSAGLTWSRKRTNRRSTGRTSAKTPPAAPGERPDDCSRTRLFERALGSVERLLVHAHEPLHTLSHPGPRRRDVALHAPRLVVRPYWLLRSERVPAAAAHARRTRRWQRPRRPRSDPRLRPAHVVTLQLHSVAKVDVDDPHRRPRCILFADDRPL